MERVTGRVRWGSMTGYASRVKLPHAQVLDMYRDVNRLLGNVVKVTPSSKAVGDFALYLINRKLKAEQARSHHFLITALTHFSIAYRRAVAPTIPSIFLIALRL